MMMRNKAPVYMQKVFLEIGCLSSFSLRKRRLFFFAVLLFSFFCPGPVFAQEAVEWKAAVCELEGKGLPKEHSYALTAIPQIVAEIVFGIDDRLTTDEERKNYLVFNSGLSVAQAELSNLIKSRNQAWFYGKSTASIDASIKAASQKILSMAPVHVEPAPVVGVKAIRGLAGLILDPVGGRKIDVYLQDNGLDFLVSGEVYEAEGYFFYTQMIYSRWTEKPLSKKTFVIPVENFYQTALNAGLHAASVLAGRPLGKISAKSIVENFRMQIDGKKTHIAPVKDLIIPAGEYSLTFSADGYKDLVLPVSVQADKTTEVEAVLEKKETLSVKIRSEGEILDIYYQGLWLGKTPLDYSTSKHELTLTAKKKSGIETTFTFIPETQNPYLIVFEEIAANSSDYTKLKRQAFYDSMGACFLAIASTTLVNGMYTNSMLSDVYSGTSFSLQTEALRYLNYGGIVLSGALLGDMLLSLNSYLSAID